MLLLSSVAALFCRRTWWLAPSNLPALLFSFCIFALIYPVYDISYSQFFCGVFIIYIFLLVSVGQRVVLNSISWIFCWKSTGSVFTAYAHAPWVMKNMSYSGNTHAHFVQAHICICRKKFNTVIPSLGIQFWSESTLIQECFKNINWRDVDKKIRLLEFYVFGNVTVSQVPPSHHSFIVVLLPQHSRYWQWVCETKEHGTYHALHVLKHIARALPWASRM